MKISARMSVVMDCQALGITYQEYMAAPKWWIELSIGKRISDKRRETT